MSDRFHPVPSGRLARWIFEELDRRGSVFGIPEELFVKNERRISGVSRFGRPLDTPIGVAAGPHTQMAPNLVSAFLTGARYIELKTVQTLDQLDVSKPCIDPADETYNCEWSQELRLNQSFEEYCKAWVLINALAHRLNLTMVDGRIGLLFNMSVGYNMEGILKPNMQRFLDLMEDASQAVEACVEEVAGVYPDVRKIDIPTMLSDNVTLSTMHGCPPDEIQKIGLYLIQTRGLHTVVKLNPTLLGPRRLREILNEKLGFKGITVPDEAFGHDLVYEDAVSMIRVLADAARRKGVHFGLKLSNTLEVVNHRPVFSSKEKMMYMSGRPLHPLTIQIARKITEEFRGSVDISFCAGVDAFNLPEVLSSGLAPVTVCSDILKSGGYTRLPQYLELLESAMSRQRAQDLDEWAVRTAFRVDGFGRRLVSELAVNLRARSIPPLSDADQEHLVKSIDRTDADADLSYERLMTAIRGLPSDRGDKENLAGEAVRVCRLINLADYADKVIEDPRYRAPLHPSDTKTVRPLSWFDCIQAPCRTACPTSQDVPIYMEHVAQGRYDEAFDVVCRENPLPSITGCVCDHPCTSKCVRSNYDAPLAIRQIKRFIAERGRPRKAPGVLPAVQGRAGKETKVAVIGCGPAGLSAASYLARQGVKVVIFEAAEGPGGMAASVIPSFRLPDRAVEADIGRILDLGVEVRYGQRVGETVSLEDIRGQGFDQIVVSVGAQKSWSMGIQNERSSGVLDCLSFLADVRAGKEIRLSDQVVVVGGGNSAMDAARTAWRLVGKNGKVVILYRRTLAEMPADPEEIEEVMAEGIEIRELTAPVRIIDDEAGRMKQVECIRMELGEKDRSGRRRPVPIEGSEHVVDAGTMITAVGQRAELSFLDGTGVEVDTKAGMIEIDPKTHETSEKNIFAGGDAVRRPETVVKALADGKRIARTILSRVRAEASPPPESIKSGSSEVFSIASRLARKARRLQRQPMPCLPVQKRKSFDEVEPVLTEEAARAEASRCLGCHDFCGLCVTVCPNRANQIYETTPVRLELPVIEMKNGALEAVMEGAAPVTSPLLVKQETQVVNIADLCNECGNCTAFCPSAGSPYKDKPRLHLDRESFDAEKDRALYLSLDPGGGGYCIEAWMDGSKAVLSVNGGKLRFRTTWYELDLAVEEREEKDGSCCVFTVVSARPGSVPPGDGKIDLEPMGKLYVLGQGLTGSCSFILS